MSDGFDLAAHARAMRAAGWWQDRTFDDLLESAIAAAPRKKAVVAYRKDRGLDIPARVMTYAGLGGAVAQAAGSLRALGIGRGDVIGLMLPNWWEFVVAAFAACRIGAVPNPLMPIFRERELRFMLGFAETKAILIPKSFRGHDFPGMINRLRPELPALEQVIVVDGDGPQSFGDLAHMDAEGYIRISGRSKDIVIRGGENIPVVEIEAILYRHPRVTDAAIVGYPDRRMANGPAPSLCWPTGRPLPWKTCAPGWKAAGRRGHTGPKRWRSSRRCPAMPPARSRNSC
ncbi:AMP-binding protein [Paracoccus sp. DMF]|uniref:AMP-binding protein n=1 Tax=Paracoccus sp. DMF TaxID=400837 RepID=UPI0021E4A617|nr:AMP-binding protein [Paracoccus sp. DMF]MCV2448363.1 AMP-binding protein [Paracoccus sp. DMF]